MIRFTCRCGHLFEEPDDAAGAGVQCPACKLLNDVPRLSDLQAIDDDGTYVLDEERAHPKPGKVDELLYVFAKTNVDEDGRSIDLRNEPDEAHDIGEFDTIETDRKRQRPRYDPETGELISPIPVAGHDRISPASIPFARPAVVYARGDTPQSRTVRHVLLELFQPINLLVMAFVLGIHLVGGMLVFLTLLRLYIVVPGLLVMLATLLAHYGNVIDEIGVDERDELPRVMRDFRWHEDVCWPIGGVLAALVFCYSPAAAFIYFFSSYSLASAIAWGALLAMIGTFFLPAVALTLLSSGSIANMRPDRVIGVIQRCGKRYFTVAATFVVAILLYLAGVFALFIELMRFAEIPVKFPGALTKLPIGLSLMIVGIFVMHAFCWEVGLLYRAYSTKFPWVGQFHERAARPPVLRQKRRYVAPPPG